MHLNKYALVGWLTTHFYLYYDRSTNLLYFHVYRFCVCNLRKLLFFILQIVSFVPDLTDNLCKSISIKLYRIKDIE